MQFLEYYSGGLRSPILSFEKASHPVVFRLFPTIHIGAPAYYAALLRHLADCDRVLYEYTSTFELGPHPTLDGYRAIARRLGLVAQIDAIDYAHVPATWVLADFTPGHAEQEIAALPRWIDRVQFTARGQAVLARLAALVPLPAREELAASLDMSQGFYEELYAETPVMTMILDDRNRVLFQAIKRYDQVQTVDRNLPFRVGIFYGAGHMPAVAEYLSQNLGYICRRGEWIDPPVFTW